MKVAVGAGNTFGQRRVEPFLVQLGLPVDLGDVHQVAGGGEHGAVRIDERQLAVVRGTPAGDAVAEMAAQEARHLETFDRIAANEVRILSVINGDRPDSRPATAMPVETVHALELPVMGRIAAGVPIEAISEKSNDVSVPASMLNSKGHHYALEVKGDSMIDAGINDGDVVVIREGNTAENGDIVVALVEGHEATLKRFRRKGATIALEAANPAYGTRLYRADQVKIQGRMVGLIRTY